MVMLYFRRQYAADIRYFLGAGVYVQVLYVPAKEDHILNHII